MFLILPSIDPLSDKNCAMPESDRLETLARLGHDFVRDHFLLTRNLRDYLTMLLCLDHPDQRVIVV